MSILSIEQAAEQLSKHYEDKRLIPFIGAGFSIPLGLPSWEGLIGWIAEKLEFEADLFLLHGNYQQLAEYVFIKDRSIWKELLNKITREFDSNETIEKRRTSLIHKALAEMDVRRIYTTNYDCHIEEALKDAGKKPTVSASLADFLESKGASECEVIKFHGTLKDHQTIILTESRYFDRMGLEDAADQRLRADILGNSFIFIGYSFSDPNIRYIWYRIDRLRRQQVGEYRIELRPSFLVTFGAGPLQATLLNNWNIHIVELDPSNKEQSLARFLREISRG